MTRKYYQKWLGTASLGKRVRLISWRSKDPQAGEWAGLPFSFFTASWMECLSLPLSNPNLTSSLPPSMAVYNRPTSQSIVSRSAWVAVAAVVIVNATAVPMIQLAVPLVVWWKRDTLEWDFRRLWSSCCFNLEKQWRISWKLLASGQGNGLSTQSKWRNASKALSHSDWLMDWWSRGKMSRSSRRGRWRTRAG